jgi:iron complex outermembrane receptor protein
MNALRRRHRCAVLIAFGVSVIPFFPAAAADSESQAQMTAGVGSADSSDQPEQVTITGSRLRTTLGQPTAQDVHIYDLPQIEVSGQTTVSGFLATVPEVSLNSVQSSNIATTVRLRGAVQGSALILVNGRRTQTTTGGAAVAGFFDVNTIPLALVQRIEILPAASSAIYGGDALAGVVNIILRSDFSGVLADAGYKYADDTDEKIFSAGAGWKKDAFSVSLMGTYSDRSALPGFDRDITANPDYRRFGGPNLGSAPFGAPATVFSVSGNLPGLNSSFAAVPIGSTGIGLTPADFAATAGTQHTGSFTQYQSSIPEEHRAGAFLSANYRFSDALEVFTEVLATHYKLDIAFTPPFVQTTTVPASNAFNPFGTAVRVSGVVQAAEGLAKINYKEDFFRPLIGARGDIGSWQWELTAQHSVDWGYQVTTGQANAASLTAALASANPATALNPFADGPWGSSSLLASIYSNQTVVISRGRSDIVDGFFRGPILELPGGSLDAVLGGEYEDSSLSRGINTNRDAKSAFAELRAPIASAVNDNGTMRELFTIQVAGRYDDYSDFGSQPTWQAGVEFRPTDSILLRSTHATAFKPPTLYNIGAPRSTVTSSVTDPKLGNQTFSVQSTSGGNPDLNPMTGTSTTAGVVWSPDSMPGLTLSVTPWWLHIDNAINLPAAQFIVDNEDLYPGRVVRAAAPPGSIGQIISVDRTYINFGIMREQGIDFSGEWRFSTGWGEFTPALAATYLTEFRGASTPGARIVNRLSRANNDTIFAPRWKGTASVSWAPDWPFKLTFAGRYIGKYRDYTPSRTLGDFWYFDASLEIDLKGALNLTTEPLSGIKLIVSATNLTDYLPPYSTYFRGYDVFNYDIVGRTIFMRLQLQV